MFEKQGFLLRWLDKIYLQGREYDLKRDAREARSASNVREGANILRKDFSKEKRIEEVFDYNVAGRPQGREIIRPVPFPEFGEIGHERSDLPVNCRQSEFQDPLPEKVRSLFVQFSPSPQPWRY